MPKRRRLLSAILAVWLCVMLISFTYTWVSRNWTPSIKGDDINIASSGALVISVLGDETDAQISLNQILSVKEDFTFRQVSSQDGVNFFWKDFSPQLTNKENPANFIRAGADGDDHDSDYLELRFCLKLDETLEKDKYIFIHPDSYIHDDDGQSQWDVDKAIRISLTYELPDGTEKTVILADLNDNIGYGGSVVSDVYKAVANLPGNKFSEDTAGAVGYQTVYDLHYFDCGRTSYNSEEGQEFCAANYDDVIRKPERTLFSMEPGQSVWVTMRIWLEGEDENCQTEIAGEDFDLFLKFDSIYVS